MVLEKSAHEWFLEKSAHEWDSTRSGTLIVIWNVDAEEGKKNDSERCLDPEPREI